MEDAMSKLPDDVKRLVAEMKEAMMFRSGKVPGYQGTGWKGYRFGHVFKSEASKMEYEDFEFPENSVILSTFPKTGTNWVGEVLRQMLYGFDKELYATATSVPRPFYLLGAFKGKQPITVTKPGEGYAEFLLGWHEYKDDPDVLFVGFEDMKKDAAKEIRRISKFLDIELTDEQVCFVKEKSSFDHMKAQQEAGADDISKRRKESNLVRTGKVGSWKEVFTVAQSEMMDEMMAQKLAGTKIKFTYSLQ